ncbi:MAG: HAD family hydrolase [Paracoccaceae bacterium]|nr:HAD family hydrolase [Paracoccaceae bacterium]
MEIEAIAFDKDGTLFDFRETWGRWAVEFLSVLADGESRRIEAAAAIGFDLNAGVFRPESVVIAGTAAEIGAALSPVVGRSVEAIVEAADEIATRTPQAPAADLEACLTELGSGRALGVVTNDSEAPALAHLEASGIARHFDFVAGYDSGHGAKPDPGPLLAFLSAVGAASERTLMVGDSRHDLAAGRRAGMGTVGVLTGLATAEELSDLADVILPDISHIAAWLAAGRPAG